MMRAVRNLRGLAGTMALLAVLAASPERGSAVLPGENGKIAFASARDGNFEIYAVNPDTTGQAWLTRDRARTPTLPGLPTGSASCSRRTGAETTTST